MRAYQYSELQVLDQPLTRREMGLSFCLSYSKIECPLSVLSRASIEAEAPTISPTLNTISGSDAENT
jgi:hypothetical protein